MTHKTCPACSESKPRDTGFYVAKLRGGAVRLSAYCKPCESRRNNGRQRERRRDAQNRISAYLSTHPCVDCGCSDQRVLEFDHRDPTTKFDRVARMISRLGWPRIQAEIDKCDVRCANCHRIKTATDGGHYEYDYPMQSGALH